MNRRERGRAGINEKNSTVFCEVGATVIVWKVNNMQSKDITKVFLMDSIINFSIYILILILNANYFFKYRKIENVFNVL